MIALLVLVLLSVIAIASLKIFEHKKIYKPETELIATPQEIGISFKEVNFPSRDKVLLNGWFIPGENEKAILFLHGNGGNISHRIEYIEVFNHLGFNTFIFDYRGYGKSNGMPTERGFYSDALGAYDKVREIGFSPDKIIIFGHSLGTAVAVFLASREKARALVVESVFLSIYELSKDVFGFYYPKWLISNKFDSIGRIKKVNIPVLIIHSKEDTLMPFYHAEKLYQAANEPKELLEIIGTHETSLMDSGTIYEEGLGKFLRNMT